MQNAGLAHTLWCRPSKTATVTLRSSTPVVDSYLHSYGLQKTRAWVLSTKQLLHGHSGCMPRPNPARLWETLDSGKSVRPSTYSWAQQEWAPALDLTSKAMECKSVHQILAPGNSKNNSTPASRPSYGKYRTRAKVFNRTFMPENSQYSANQSSLRRDRRRRQGNIRGYDNCSHTPKLIINGTQLPQTSSLFVSLPNLTKISIHQNKL